MTTPPSGAECYEIKCYGTRRWRPLILDLVSVMHELAPELEERLRRLGYPAEVRVVHGEDESGSVTFMEVRIGRCRLTSAFDPATSTCYEEAEGYWVASGGEECDRLLRDLQDILSGYGGCYRWPE